MGFHFERHREEEPISWAAKAAAEVYFEGATGTLGERNESESSLITSFRFIRILLACHQLLLLQLLL